jgi:Flp pilus assembly pilin Flp
VLSWPFEVKTFVSDESGAVTVDWVVLTAAIVGLGLAVMSVVSGGVEDLSGDISTALTNTDPLSDPFDNANQQAPTDPVKARRVMRGRCGPGTGPGPRHTGAGFPPKTKLLPDLSAKARRWVRVTCVRKRRRHPSWAARGLN